MLPKAGSTVLNRATVSGASSGNRTPARSARSATSEVFAAADCDRCHAVTPRRSTDLHRELDRFGQLVEIVDRDHAVTAEVGLIRVPVAGERPGVRSGCRRALGRPADLQRDHRLARGVHRAHCARKGHGIAQRFDEERNGPGLAIIGEIRKVVRHVEHRGVAYGDEVGKTETPQRGERNARRAAMGNDGEAAIPHPLGYARAV